MNFSPTPLAGSMLIELDPHRDERGFFARAFCREEFADQGLDPTVAQCNVSYSPRKLTLRGMHYQAAPHAEVKLVRCTQGTAFDVALDLRPDSATFRRWFGLELDADSGRMLYIPEGCAHGYMTLAPNTEVAYQTSVPYTPSSARGVRYDDPAFAIRWPRKVQLISHQDATWGLYGGQAGTAAP